MVWDDFDALYAQLQSMRAAAPDGGCYEILFSDEFAGCVITANQPYDMTQTTWVGTSDRSFGTSPSLVILTLDSDVEIIGLREIRHLMVESLGGAAAPVADLSQGDFFYLTDGAVLFGGSPILSFDPGQFKTATLMLRHASSTTAPILLVGPGANLQINVDKFSVLGSNTVVGDATSTLTLQLEGMLAATPAALQPPFLGTITVNSVPSSYNLFDVPVPVGGAFVGTVNRVTTSGIPATVDLPPAASYPGGVVIVKNPTADPTAITITPFGAETIDGAPTLVIATPFGSVTLVSNGVSDWMVIT